MATTLPVVLASMLLGAALTSALWPTYNDTQAVQTTPVVAVPPAPSIEETTPPPPPTQLASVGAFTMNTPQGDINATYDTMPYVLPLNPAGPQETMVRWVEGWGVPPVDNDEGTTYVLGHAWGKQQLVFNLISETVTNSVDPNNPNYITGTDGMDVSRIESDVLNGSTITMSDEDGNQREWEVTRSWLVGKNDAIADPDIMDESRKGRVVLIACSVQGSEDLGYNVIVEGFLKDTEDEENRPAAMS